MPSEDSQKPVLAVVFLRQIGGGLYYARAGGWTAHLPNALDFRDTVAAYSFSRRSGFTKVEVAVRTQQGEYCIPVNDSQPA